MNALDWLKKQQEDSLRRKAIFDARPRVAASQAWSGYADKPGGQRLMVRQPEVKNKLVQKRGDLTMTKEWVDNARFQKEEPDDSYIKVTPLPRVEDAEGTRTFPLDPRTIRDVAGGYARQPRTVTPGTTMAPRSIREVASGYARQPRTPVPPNAWLDAMRHRTYNPDIYEMRAATPEAQAAIRPPVMKRPHYREVPRGADIPVTNDMVSAPRETWGGDLNLTMPQHHLTRGWIQDPSTILNIGNLIKSMGRPLRDIDDRRERNRIRRLMENRTANPYYRGGLY